MASTVTYPEISLTNTTSRNSFANMFKDDYLPKLGPWIRSSESSKIAPMVMTKRGTMGGVKSVAAVFTANPQSIGYGFEGHRLPTPSSSTSTNPSIISRTLRYRLRWTEESQTAARKGDSVAWSAPKAAELELARDELSHRVNRNLHHGRVDIIGRILSVASNVYTLQAINSRRGTSTAFFDLGSFHARVGQDINLVDATVGIEGGPAWDPGTQSGGTEVAARITAVGGTDSAPTITVDDADGVIAGFTPAVGDFIIQHGSRTEDADDTYETTAARIGRFAAMNGLTDFGVDSTVTDYAQGLVKSDVSGMQPRYMANGGTQRAFTELLVHGLMRNIRVKTSKTPSKLLMSDATYTEVMKENMSGRRFDPVIGESGHRNLAYVDFNTTLKYEVDWQCLPGIIWAIEPSLYGYFEQKALSAPPGYEGEVRVVDYAMSEVVATQMGNIMHKRPEVGGAIDDLIFDHFNV